MRRITLLLFFLIPGMNVSGQQIDTLYFKDTWMVKPSIEKKAKFYEVTVLHEGGLETRTLYSMSNTDIVVHREFIDGYPTGSWIDERPRSMNKMKADSFNLRYSDEKVEGGIYPGLPGNSQEDGLEPVNLRDFYLHVAPTIRYPPYAKSLGLQGKVYVHLKVTKEGDVQLLSIPIGVHSSLDREAARIVMQCPDLSPAKKDGVPIDSYYVQGITFKLSN